MNMLNDRQKVFVGLSGGVDSSVAAALLKERGFDVTGVFIKVWYPPFMECNWREERRDAKRVAAHLGIPFQEFDLSETYKKEVVDYMIASYSKGETPNPDVMCNSAVKFGAFLKEAVSKGADFIATGHYARKEGASAPFHLLRGMDEDKDQTYFLWTLDQKKLSRSLFPVGNMKKEDVRKKAESLGLFTATKKDSQGVCFIGKIGMKDFLKEYIKEHPGKVLDESGRVIGHHSGARFYTLGERRGFTVTKQGAEDLPRYVVSKDIEKNTITVSEKAHQDKRFLVKRAVLDKVNFIASKPIGGYLYQSRFRHRQPLVSCQIEETSDKMFETVFAEAQSAVSPGQSLVFYDGEECLGGGVIKKIK